MSRTDRCFEILSPTYQLDSLSPADKLACAWVDDGTDLVLSLDIHVRSNAARNLHTATSCLLRLGYTHRSPPVDLVVYRRTRERTWPQDCL